MHFFRHSAILNCAPREHFFSSWSHQIMCSTPSTRGSEIISIFQSSNCRWNLWGLGKPFSCSNLFTVVHAASSCSFQVTCGTLIQLEPTFFCGSGCDPWQIQTLFSCIFFFFFLIRTFKIHLNLPLSLNTLSDCDYQYFVQHSGLCAETEANFLKHVLLYFSQCIFW